MRFTSRTSIKYQLTLLIFIASLTVTLVTASMFIYLETKEREQELEQYAKTAVNILAQDFARAIMLNSPDMAVEMVLKLEAFPSIRHALFVDNSNVPILYYTHPDETPVELKQSKVPSFEVNDDLAEIGIPILYHDIDHGAAYFQFDYRAFDTTL